MDLRRLPMTKDAFDRCTGFVKDLMRRSDVHHASAWRVLPDGSLDLIVRFDLDEQTAFDVDGDLPLNRGIARTKVFKNAVVQLFVIANGSAYSDFFTERLTSAFGSLTELLRDPRSFATLDGRRTAPAKPPVRRLYYQSPEAEQWRAIVAEQRFQARQVEFAARLDRARGGRRL